MKLVKIHEGAQGWEPGSTGLRDSREGVHEHTGVMSSVRSCTPSLESCLPPEAAPTPERSCTPSWPCSENAGGFAPAHPPTRSLAGPHDPRSVHAARSHGSLATFSCRGVSADRDDFMVITAIIGA